MCILWSWKDFPVYKFNGIPFDAHLAKSLILILSAKFSSRIFFTEKAQLLPQTYDIYSYKDVLYLGPLKKVLIVEISLVSQYNIFLHWILCDITYTCIIHLTQYIDKTYSVKQMCASVLLKLNIKLFFGIKHNTQIKRYAIRRKMNVHVYVNTCFSYFFQIPV